MSLWSGMWFIVWGGWNELGVWMLPPGRPITGGQLCRWPEFWFLCLCKEIIPSYLKWLPEINQEIWKAFGTIKCFQELSVLFSALKSWTSKLLSNVMNSVMFISSWDRAVFFPQDTAIPRGAPGPGVIQWADTLSSVNLVQFYISSPFFPFIFVWTK